MRKVVEEAYATTESLRSLAKPLLLTIMDLLTMRNRLEGMDLHEKHKYRAELDRIALSLNLDKDEELASAHAKFYRYHTWDHFASFYQALSPVNGIDPNVSKALGELIDFASTAFPTEKQTHRIIAPVASTLSEEHEELLRDYLHYKEHHALRRSEALGNR